MASIVTAPSGGGHSGKRFVQKHATRLLSPVLLAVAALALSACGEGGGKAASQLAAKVNSSEISIHQINYALRNLPYPPPEQLDATKRRILDELVDQELAMQQAVAAKLDRKPEVMQSIEAARREILARAYLEQLSAQAPAPGANEVADYYRRHPELFSARKIYQLYETSLAATPELLAGIRGELARGRDAADLMAWAKARRTEVDGGPTIKPAERVELEILPALAKMREGETALFEVDGKAVVVTLARATPEALGEDEARPLIENFLRRQRGESIEKDATRKLRAEARIEYQGEFSSEAAIASRQQAEASERARREAEAAREAARRQQAQESEARAEAARKARAEAETARMPGGALPPPPEQVVRKGMADFK